MSSRLMLALWTNLEVWRALKNLAAGACELNIRGLNIFLKSGLRSIVTVYFGNQCKGLYGILGLVFAQSVRVVACRLVVWRSQNP